MRSHMITAHRMMEEQETIVRRHFLSDEERPRA